MKKVSCILLCLFFLIFSSLDARLVKSIIRTRDAVVENQLTAGSILVHGDLNVEGLISASGNSGSNSSVVGPSSSTNNAVARFSGTTGKVIKNSGVIVDDSNNITVSEQGSLRLADIAGGEYVGISAPDSITSNYTLKLPSSAPLVNQFLQAGSSTATDLRWVDLADFASPEISRMIYVSKAGNDTTGDGSAEKPFLTVAKGVEVANSLASSSNRIGVNIGAGTFIEANPISITVQGVSLIGNSITSTYIEPNNLSANLFAVTVPEVGFSNFTIDAGDVGSTASGISFNSNVAGVLRIQSVAAYRFLTGLEISGGGVPIIVANDFQPRGNSTGVSVSNARLLIKNSIFLGPFSGATAANVGLTVTGSSSLVTVLSNSFRLMGTAISSTSNSHVRVLGTAIESGINGVVASGSSVIQVVGGNFVVNSADSVNASSSGAGTVVSIESCFFNGVDSNGDARGIGVKVENSGFLEVLSSHFSFLVTAVVAGEVGDTSSTKMILSNSYLHENTADVTQSGSSTLQVAASTISKDKTTINDSTNVQLTYFDLNNSSVLTLGNQINIQQRLLQVDNGFSNLPQFQYFPNFYGHDSLVYDNSVSEGQTGVGFGVVSQAALGHTKLYVTNKDRTTHDALVLQSDTGIIGSSSSGIRRWTISREGEDADLQFNFLNNDTGDGKSSVTNYSLMQADGFNNNLEFPSSFSDGTQLIWQTDTNLYRSAADTLKTDDNFIADGTATINSTLSLATGSITDSGGSISFGNENLSTTGTFGASATTVTGTSDTVQFTVTGNDTQTSNIFVFRDSTPTNLLTLSNAGALNLSGTMTSSGLMTMNVDVGDITGDKNLTTKEYVDNVASGLNPIASVRLVENTTNLDLDGNETIDGVLTVNGDRVLVNAQTDPIENGPWVVNAAGAWTRPADFANGSLIVSGTSVFVQEGDVYTNSTWVLTEGAGGTVGTNDVKFTIFSSPGTVTASNVGGADGQVFKQKTGNDLEFKTFSGSNGITITNNVNTIDVTTNATSSNTNSTIVSRDGSGNFSAGTITATNLVGTLTTAAQPNITSLGTLTGLTMSGAINLDSNNITNGGTIGATTFNGDLSGTASGNLALTGGTLSGDLQIPAGTTTDPSLQFTGSTTSGLSVVSDTMSIITNGTQRMSVSSSGTVSIKDSVNGFGSAGVVVNDASGNLSSTSSLGVTSVSAENVTGTNSIVGGNVTISNNSVSCSSSPLTLSNGAGNGLQISTAAKLVVLQPLCLNSIQNVTPTAGATTTVDSGSSVVIFDTSGGNVSGQTISMPSTPLNGQLLYMVAGPNNLTNLTFTNGTIVDAPTTFNAAQGRAVQFIYNSSNSSWYVLATS